MRTALGIRGEAWPPIALALATLAAYAGVRDHAFLNFDDPQYVSENAIVLAGLSARGLRWALTTSHFANWSPLTWISLMLDSELFGARAGPRLVENAVLHAGAALALYAALRRATGARGRSLVVAGLFALHPLHVESVAWVSSRKDVLSALFWMLAMNAHVGWGERGRWWSYAWLLLFTALGLAAKSVVATLPFVLLLLDGWPLGRLRLPGAPASPRAVPLRRLVLEKLPLVALGVATLILTLHAQREGGALVDLARLPFGARLANAVRSYALYLVGAFWPANLAAFYPIPADLLDAPAARWELALAALLLVGLSAVAIASIRRRPWLAVGWLWYLGVLIPMIGLVQIGRQAMADRYSYLPLVGIFLAATWAAEETARRTRSPRWLAPLGAVIVLAACAGATLQQVGYWRDSVTLFERTLAVTADNAIAHNNLGAALASSGRTDEAVAEFDAAVRLDPNYTRARENLALALDRLGRIDEATSVFQSILALDPNRASAHFGLAHLALEMGDPASAVPEYEAGLAADPDNAIARSNLGLALLQLGKPDEAAAQLSEAVRRDPMRVDARVHLAEALLAMGRPEDALEQARAALELAPEDAALRSELGLVLARLESSATGSARPSR